MNTLKFVCLAAILIGTTAVLAADTTAHATESTATPATNESLPAKPDTTAINNATHNDTTSETPPNNSSNGLTTAVYTTQSADAVKVYSILEHLKDHHCNDTDGKPCDFKHPAHSDKKSLCSALDAAADCIKQCDVTAITDDSVKERKNLNCDAGAFVQGSLVMLLMATLLHFLL